MPTVLRIGPYRFFFYSNENDEPMHIHVLKRSSSGKILVAAPGRTRVEYRVFGQGAERVVEDRERQRDDVHGGLE